MEPTPGGYLEDLNELLSDPTVQIVARLAQLPTVINPDELTLAQITECDFPGYAPFTYTPQLETAAEDELYAEMGVYNVEFQVGAIVTPQRIVGIYVTAHRGADPVTIVTYATFDPPLLASEPGQVFGFDGTLAALPVLGS